MSAVFATGADDGYGWQLLNLLGSLHANSPGVFDRIVAYDLGLAPGQRELLDAVRGVEVREVPPFVEHWRRGFTWKPWIWRNVAAAGDEVLWVDAGATILRSLAPVVDEIGAAGSFLVSQGGALRDLLPREWYTLYRIDEQPAGHEYAAAGVIGFTVGSEFFERVIVPTQEDCAVGRSLGFSPGEEWTLNRGLNATQEPQLVDCTSFRWDQSVLNARLFAAFPEPPLHDLQRYAGWQSRRDHPQQLIWHHRRNGPLTYLTRVPYVRDASLRGRLAGYRQRRQWWLRHHRYFFTPTPYVLKLRALARALPRGRRPSAPM